MQEADCRSDSLASVVQRRIENPLIGDVATFVETSAETGGERTVVEIDLAPQGGNDPHYHLTYAERFEVLAGRLRVQAGGVERDLVPGELADAPAGVVHCFSNPWKERARFRVTLTPGHEGFERSLAIGYGLAADGKTNAASIPRDPLVLATLLELSEMRLPGVRGALTTPLKLLAPLARRRGVRAKLEQRYLGS